MRLDADKSPCSDRRKSGLRANVAKDGVLKANGSSILETAKLQEALRETWPKGAISKTHLYHRNVSIPRSILWYAVVSGLYSSDIWVRLGMARAKRAETLVEEAKRLAPTPATLRELYLKSGNLCAFPGCSTNLVNADGAFIAQLCHIEAAKAGGERFNNKSNNDERRSAANLVFMCYPHHVETNDVVKYPVAILKEIKSKHEAKFAGIIATIEKAVVDRSRLVILKKGANLRKLLSKDDLLYEDAYEKELEDVQKLLQDLPPQTREVLLLLVEKVNARSLDILATKFLGLSSLSEADTRKHVYLLIDAGIVEYDEHGENSLLSKLRLDSPKTNPVDWPLLGLLKTHEENHRGSLRKMIVGLDFSSLAIS